MPYDAMVNSLIAGLIASLACAMGVLPLMLRGIDPARHTGLGYGFAGGLMFAASVYNLILPGLTLGDHELSLRQVVPVVAGILLGTLVLWGADRAIPKESLDGPQWKKWGGRSGVLIFLAMCIHSVPEGVAVGVAYASDEVYTKHLGPYIATAIAIHNIPEGLVVAIPLRASGVSMPKCFLAAFLTSLPQPMAAVPASVVSWLFQPVMPLLMGFAAGAMIFLVLVEMIPDALATSRPAAIAWAFMLGFCAMLLLQVAL